MVCSLQHSGFERTLMSYPATHQEADLGGPTDLVAIDLEEPTDLISRAAITPDDPGEPTELVVLGDDTDATHIDQPIPRPPGCPPRLPHRPSVRAGSQPPPIPRGSQRRLATGTVEPPSPRSLGGYTITGALASGGMGVVYRGEHPARPRAVAIKAMHPRLQKNIAVVDRFFAESVATARIDHPNVVRFFDFGHDAEGSPYLVMELLEGETLSSRLARERQLDLASALDIAIQIGLGLAAAHQQHVVHRDIKPDNIFLATNPARPGFPTVKLLDFGVAKVEGHHTSHTWQGDLLGTPSYMAPEQGLAAAESDARSDLYSVGCVLFEMVCGAVPFTGNLVETLLAHQTSERPSPRALNPAIPPDLEHLIDRLIARDPADRPQGASDMVQALTAIETSDRFAAAPRPRSGTELVGHRAGRARWRGSRLAMVVAFGILAGALSVLGWFGAAADPPGPVAAPTAPAVAEPARTPGCAAPPCS